MKKILITGGNGIIGSSLVKHLYEQSNYEITVIVNDNERFNQSKIYKNVIYLSLDLTKSVPKGFFKDRFHFIIHLAAKAHSKDSKSIYYYNSLITKNLVNSLVNYSSHFIFFSSVSVYGESNRKYPISVNDYCRPASHYGKSKLSDENFIRSIFKSYTIVRLCPMVSGKTNKDLLKRVYLPNTSIKYYSPFKRVYNFSNLEIINNFIYGKLIEENLNEKKIYNLHDGIRYDQKTLIDNYPGRTIKFNFFVLYPVFFVLKLFSFNSTVYKINCLFWKMFKTNTYD